MDTLFPLPQCGVIFTALLLLGALLFGAAVVPDLDAETQQLRLLTHNLHAEETMLDPFVEIIRQADAHIVSLQEVSPSAVARFETEFASLYPYRFTNADAAGRYAGQMILSRYPLLDSQNYFPTMRLLRAEIDLNGQVISVFNLHQSTPGTELNFGPRDADVAFALQQAAQAAGAVLLMGDFNTEPWSETYQSIAAQYNDAYAQAGQGPAPTYPDYSQPQARVNARLPTFMFIFLRLDYIFYSDHFRALEAHVWPTSGGSDHRPVFARLALSVDFE